MTIKSVNIALLAVLLLMMATIFLFRRDYTERNAELLPGMVASVAYKPYSANPNFIDRKTLQAPVKGSVIRGVEPYPYGATAEEALQAGRELRSPLAPRDSVANVARGAFVFTTYCVPCHGPGGAGDGVIPQRGYPPPPSLMAENALRLKDGQAYHIITMGQRNMPPLAAQVVRNDRWKVVQYVRSLQQRSLQANAVAR